MELQTFLQATRDALASGQLEEALKLTDRYFIQKGVTTGELSDDLLKLKARLWDFQQKKLDGVLSQDELTRLYNTLVVALLELLNKVVDYETNQVVRAKASGRGMLMHNIPGHMPLQAKSRCTVRVGAVEEALLRNFQQTAYTHIQQDIKVAQVMKVELLAEGEGIFDIKTVNSPDQETDLETYTEWRFDVTPHVVGVFPLHLKVSTVRIIDQHERAYEQVYEVSVTITTVAEHLAPETGDGKQVLRTWASIAAVEGKPEREKSFPIVDIPKPQKAVELDLDKWLENARPPQMEVPQPRPHDAARMPGHVPQKSSKAWVILIVAPLLALAAYFAYRYLETPNPTLVEAMFEIDPQVGEFTVLLNGQPLTTYLFDAGNSAIVLRNLTVGETYAVEVQGQHGTCTNTVTIKSLYAKPYLLNCRMDAAPIPQFEILVRSPYPIETLLLDGSPVDQATGLLDIRLMVDEGMHKLEAVFTDGKTSCEAVEAQILTDSVVALNCKRLDPNNNNEASFKVQLRVSPHIYKLSQGKIRPMVDREVWDIKPTVQDDYFVFHLNGIPSGQHVFSLTGVYEQYVCIDISQEIAADAVLTFECNQGG